MIIRRALILSSLAVALAASPLIASAQTVDPSGVPSMVAAINAERARFNLAPLVEDSRLDAVAASHSLEMARARFFSHTSPSTGQPADRVTQAGLGWTAVAENIAINQSPEAAQQSLLRSPGHHDNMVDPAQRSVGIGIVRHGDQVWVTQLFATLNHPQTNTTAPVVAAPVAPVQPSVAPTAQRPEEDCDTDDADDADEGDDPDTAPSPPVAPVAPAAPMSAGLPLQGIPGLEQFLTGLGLTRQPMTTPSNRVAASPQVYTVQTPFGPVRVELPSSAAAPSAATPTAPARPRSARPAPAPRFHRRVPPRGRVVEVDTLDV